MSGPNHPEINAKNADAENEDEALLSPQNTDRSDNREVVDEADDGSTSEDGRLMVSDLTPSEEDEGKGLARTLTLTNCVTMIVGCIIGSGIFVSPTGVQHYAGSVGASIAIWTLCGIWCGIGAYIYAELGSLITKSGGDYAYIFEALGSFIGFLRLWIDSMVVRPVAISVITLTFALYIVHPFYQDCDPPPFSVELLAIAVILLLCGINCYSVKAVARLQDWFTIAKVLALLTVILTSGYLLIFGKSMYWDSFDHIFEGNFRTFGSAAVAFYSGLFAYQGWAYLNTITEELINPRRNLPLAFLISMTIVTVVYVLYNIALYVVLSPDEIILHPAASVTYANKIYGKFSFIMSLFVAISTFGSANGSLMMSSRLFFCGAREGQMPVILAMTNKHFRTPIPSVILMSMLAIGYILLSSNVFVLINASQTTVWVAYTLAGVALLVLRYKMPDAYRPIKVNIAVPIIFIIGGVTLVTLSAIGEPKDTAIGWIIVFTAIPFYILFIALEQPTFLRRIMYNFTAFCQKLFMLVDENKEI